MEVSRPGKMIKFKPKEKIWGWIGGKRTVFFGTLGEYEGELLPNGNILATPIGLYKAVEIHRKRVKLIGCNKNVPNVPFLKK